MFAFPILYQADGIGGNVFFTAYETELLGSTRRPHCWKSTGPAKTFHDISQITEVKLKEALPMGGASLYYI